MTSQPLQATTHNSCKTCTHRTGYYICNHPFVVIGTPCWRAREAAMPCGIEGFLWEPLLNSDYSTILDKKITALRAQVAALRGIVKEARSWIHNAGQISPNHLVSKTAIEQVKAIDAVLEMRGGEK